MKSLLSRWLVVAAVLGGACWGAGVAGPGARERSGSGRATAAGAAEGPQSWALAVGINDYQSEDINDLQFAVADVKAVSEALVAAVGFPRDSVLIMTSEAPATSIDCPTHVNVIKRLDYLANSVKPGDTFFFYFSGHGYQRQGGRHFLGTVNTDPATIETLQMTSIPLELLREKMAKIRARQVIIVVDACRNDPEKGRGEGDNYLSDGFARDLLLVARAAGAGIAGNAVLFACSAGERAHEWSEVRHGAFSYYLLEGLRGKAAEPGGDITMASLGDYVQRAVVRWAVQRGKQQTPDLHQQGAARIVLGRVGAPGGGPPLPPNRPPTVLTPPPTGISPGMPGQTWTNPKDGMEFVYVPAGEFTMGSEDGNPDEKPTHRVWLPGYWIGKCEVMVGQFRRFAQESGYRPEGEWQKSGTDDRLPVAWVTWNDAVAYCRWAGVRLPTEAEWEKAARGTDGRTYPWGNTWNPAKCNNYEHGTGRTKPVGSIPEGVSPCGCLDMLGNVWEWCSSTYKPYPYRAEDGRENTDDRYGRMIRGASFTNGTAGMHSADRLCIDRGSSKANVGFRCAISSE